MVLLIFVGVTLSRKKYSKVISAPDEPSVELQTADNALQWRFYWLPCCWRLQHLSLAANPVELSILASERASSSRRDMRCSQASWGLLYTGQTADVKNSRLGSALALIVVHMSNELPASCRNLSPPLMSRLWCGGDRAMDQTRLGHHHRL